LRRELATANSFGRLEQRLECIARVPPQLVDRPRRQRRAPELRELRGTGLVASRFELTGEPFALGDEGLDRRLVQRCHSVVVGHSPILDTTRGMLDR